jgi:hypothetical protein
MISPVGVEVDILPFGGLEIDGEILVVAEGVTSIKANDFMEALIAYMLNSLKSKSSSKINRSNSLEETLNLLAVYFYTAINSVFSGGL